MQSKKFNWIIAIKMLLLLGFALFYAMTIWNGTAGMYVHPRNVLFMAIAAAVMVLIACLYARELFTPRKQKTKLYPLLFFIIPLVMAFALPAQTIDADSGNIGNVALQNEARSGSNNAALQQTQAPSENENPAYSAIPSLPDTGLSLQNGVIVMDSEHFSQWLDEIYYDTDAYLGKQIEVVGFVFKDNEEFGTDAFVPARLMMVCCAADMQPVGLLCRYDKTGALEEDTWVKVTGTIAATQFDGDTIPCIDAKSVEKTAKPAQDYVYPF